MGDSTADLIREDHAALDRATGLVRGAESAQHDRAFAERTESPARHV